MFEVGCQSSPRQYTGSAGSMECILIIHEGGTHIASVCLAMVRMEKSKCIASELISTPMMHLSNSPQAVRRRNGFWHNILAHITDIGQRQVHPIVAFRNKRVVRAQVLMQLAGMGGIICPRSKRDTQHSSRSQGQYRCYAYVNSQ